jgi:hypothetical protein
MGNKTLMYVVVAAVVGTSTLIAMREIVRMIIQVFASASSVLGRLH